MSKYLGLSVEKLVAKGFKLVEKNCNDYGNTYDVYSAYFGYMVLVQNNVVVYDLEEEL